MHISGLGHLAKQPCRFGVCGCGIVGQDGAVKHAKDKGHINFQEFK